jgi:uncharacterized protein YndB with AHSA1/START domain
LDELHCEIKINASLNSIWEAWTNSDLLTEWFSPEANIEPKVKGSFELFFDPTNHDHQSTKGCVITFIKPMEEISFTWKGPNHFAEIMNNPSSLTLVNVLFLKDANNVLIKLSHSGWGSTDKWDKAKSWHQEQWQIVLKDLKSFLESVK